MMECWVYVILCITAETLSSTLRLRPDGRAQRKDIFFSADPEGIGSAFHGAEEGRKENISLTTSRICIQFSCISSACGSLGLNRSFLNGAY